MSGSKFVSTVVTLIMWVSMALTTRDCDGDCHDYGDRDGVGDLHGCDSIDEFWVMTMTCATATTAVVVVMVVTVIMVRMVTMWAMMTTVDMMTVMKTMAVMREVTCMNRTSFTSSVHEGCGI